MVMSVQHNPIALTAYRNLASASVTMGKSIEKLSSGFRINTAADAPADLVMSEQLRAQIEGLERAIRNTTETKNLLSITEGALGEVQNILRNMRKLAIHAANSGITSPDQIAADQAEMDWALKSIDHILGTTGGAGRKILENMMNEGKISNNWEEIDSSANQNAAPADSDKSLEDSPKNLALSGGTMYTSPVPQVDENGNLLSDKTVTLMGKDADPAGLAAYTFSAGTSLADVIAKLREFAIPDEEAAALDPNAQPPAGSPGLDAGQVRLDMAALSHLQGLDDDAAREYMTSYLADSSRSPVLKAEGTTLGTPIKLSDSDRRLAEFSRRITDLSTAGLGGTDITGAFGKDGLQETRNLTLGDMYSGGLASLERDPVSAMKIIEQAIKDISAMRSEIGSIQSMRLQAEEDNLRTELENLTKTESFLRDTDMAKEMMEFTRSQILSQVGTQMLSAANQQGQNILNLLA